MAKHGAATPGVYATLSSSLEETGEMTWVRSFPLHSACAANAFSLILVMGFLSVEGLLSGVEVIPQGVDGDDGREILDDKTVNGFGA